MAVGLPGPIICPIPGTKSEENLGKNLERRHPARPLVKTRFLILAIAAGLVAVTAACGNTATSTPPPVIPTATLVPVPAAAATAVVTPTETTNAPPGAQRPVVQVGNLEFPVDLAADLAKRTRDRKSVV